uniref:ABC transporter domain-containing protein n=1 Tax=Glossina austeni TaxID=7395 RepID=A0A1A9VL11_GLOAU
MKILQIFLSRDNRKYLSNNPANLQFHNTPLTPNCPVYPCYKFSPSCDGILQEPCNSAYALPPQRLQLNDYEAVVPYIEKHNLVYAGVEERIAILNKDSNSSGNNGAVTLLLPVLVFASSNENFTGQDSCTRKQFCRNSCRAANGNSPLHPRRYPTNSSQSNNPDHLQFHNPQLRPNDSIDQLARFAERMAFKGSSYGKSPTRSTFALKFNRDLIECCNKVEQMAKEENNIDALEGARGDKTVADMIFEDFSTAPFNSPTASPDKNLERSPLFILLEKAKRCYSRKEKHLTLQGSQARLNPIKENNQLVGLEITVVFNGIWKESLDELSGGQRSLVALSSSIFLPGLQDDKLQTA